MKTKTYRCTDGFVTKTIEAASANDAAEAYAIVTCNVDVVQLDDDGREIGEHETVAVSCGGKKCDWCDNDAVWQDTSSKNCGCACGSHKRELERVVIFEFSRTGNPFAGESAEGFVRPMPTC